MNGEHIKCVECDGHGLVSSFVNYPEAEECRACNGSGTQWRYPGGAIAKHYGGALVGREHKKRTAA